MQPQYCHHSGARVPDPASPLSQAFSNWPTKGCYTESVVSACFLEVTTFIRSVD
jgi:hypothetical protein